MISTTEILYAFSGSAASRRLILGQSETERVFGPHRVYIRTANGNFLSDIRSLAALAARLDPRQFLAVNQGLLVNLLKIVEIDFSGVVKQLGVAVAGGAREWITVSRRRIPLLRRILGLPRRGGRTR
jgi:hypothetical protein